MKGVEIARGIFTINDVLSANECGALISRVEALGFETATINTRHGPEVDRDFRNNERAIVDDRALAADLWSRVRDAMPPFLAGRQARGLNERFRYYRYVPGQKFAWHTDGSFRRENGEASMLTFMVYLNEGYTGGETLFASVQVQGRTGMALVFEHALSHEGAEVSNGTKYVLRSDVMYGPVGQIAG
jgi:prolyl 4-hydroxylase